MLATIQKWLGKTTKESDALGAQCVAWAKKFAEEENNPIGNFSGSALNGWNTGSPFVDTKWQRVPYTPGSIPNCGDIFFLDKTSKNPYGHVGVVGEGSSLQQISVVEQNAGTGNGDGQRGNAITARTYGYKSSRGNILGWYTLNPITMENTTSQFKQTYIQERPVGYKPIFTDLAGNQPATISDVKYLIEIANIRKTKAPL